MGRAVFRLLGMGLAAGCVLLGGCMVPFGLASVMGQSFEYQKLIEVPPKYAGLENRKVAVLVNVDLSILYQYPTLAQTVSFNVSSRIARNVPGVQVVSPQAVAQWQYRTPQWTAMPLGEVADAFGVERVVFIDVYEFRLNPPGNSWMWDGVCEADVGIAERDNFDPDSFVEMFPVRATFPDIPGVTREEATAAQIETGVMTRFLERTAWLFYLHEEPKYPDKYDPSLDRSRDRT